jgi:glycoprotein 3-alpha-L-fucosyltransferase
MGARPQDYADVAPPHSYIHVDDFRSPRDLADYLRVLDANDTLYNEYFRWKSDWVVTSDTNYWCRICGLLHSATDPDFRLSYVHWYPDYGTWWNGVCSGYWTMQNGARWQTWKNTSLGRMT